MIKSCIPIISVADVKKSLRFWSEALGLAVDREMYEDDQLIGCMVYNEYIYFWLNQLKGREISDDYDGIRLYWAPTDIHTMRSRLLDMGFAVSAIEERDYGQTEFFVIDDDGYNHCFGVATNQ